MNSCCEGLACALCRGYTKELAREGLVLSVDINTKSSCLPPVIYKEQVRNQPHGRDCRLWRMKRRVFHTGNYEAEMLRCDSTLVTFCAQRHSRAARSALRSGLRQFHSLLGDHSAQWLTADPLFLIPSRPPKLFRNPPWSCLQELKWEGQKQNILGMFIFYSLKYFWERD